MQSGTWTKALAVALVTIVAAFALASCSTGGASEAASSSGASGGSSQASFSSDASSGSSSSSAAVSSASSSSSLSASASSGSTITGMATGVLETQVVGNDEIGYVQVPSDWEDRTEDFAIGTVDAYKIVYYANPSTKYASDTLGHDSYEEALQLMVAPASNAAMAADIVADFKRNTDSFSLVESRDVLVGERPAVLVLATMPKDGLRVATLVIDRDGDGRVAVAITMNCGKTDASLGEALERAMAWSRQVPAAPTGVPAQQEGAPAADEAAPAAGEAASQL